MADRTESSIVVDAAPGEVLDVIADFDAYPEWTGAVRQAEVLEEDEDGRARTVRFVLDAGALRDTYTLAYTWDIVDDGTGTVAWTLVEAGILKAMDGSYRLRAHGAGAAGRESGGRWARCWRRSASTGWTSPSSRACPASTTS